MPSVTGWPTLGRWRAQALLVRETEHERRANVMREVLKVAACALLVALLSPMAGFWVVALVGSTMLLLPLGIAVSTAFPRAWKRIWGNLFAGSGSLSAQ